MSDQIEVTRVTGLVINCSHWFARPDFQAWLNDPNKRIMTWHQKGTVPDEWSDTMLLVDPSLGGEGAHEDMPEDILDEIVAICLREHLQHNGPHIPVRLVNVPL